MDNITKKHTKTGNQEGSIKQEVKAAIIGVVREMYNIWVSNEEYDDSVLDIAVFLRSILGCALT